jgi:hypothetical protein
MANPRIEVEIGAKVDDLASGINQVTGQLGKLENAVNQATPEINKLSKATSQYNSVGTDFARIIQDAPFGIIGVGNNITQLASSFQTLRAQSTSTGAALKTAFSSIISPANLLVLGVSAVTTALTVYSMTAKDTGGSVDDLKQSQDEFNQSLKETDQILKQGFFNQLLKDVGLIRTENVGGRLIDVPAFEKADEVLQKLGGTIDTLNKNQLEALRSFLGEKIGDATRNASNATNDLEKSLALQDFDVYKSLLNEVNNQLAFYKTNTEKSTKATKDLKQEIFSFSTNPLVDAYFEAIRVGAEFQDSLQKAFSGLTGLEGENPIIGIQNQIAQSLVSLGEPVKELADQANNNLERVKLKIDDLSGAFVGLGSVIGKAFKNPQLGTFLGQFAQFVTKIIAGAFAVSKANAVAGATQSSLFTGPAAAFTLPAFIATAVGLVALAFSSIKGGAGSSSSLGATGGGVGSTFTGLGSIGGQFNANREIKGELVARGADLVYVFNEANNRINKG